ncbi:ATP-binding cassette domain-containing protein [bacterium]|nr:ATP-binding cassette domain-containing protein [bacterium]
MSDVLLTTSELEVGYGGRAFLPPLNWQVRRGEIWAVIGPNGGGKTTILRTVLGLNSAVGGRVKPSAGLRIGYVPQRETLDSAVPARVCDVVRSGADRGWSFLRPARLVHDHAALERAMDDTDVRRIRTHSYRALSEGQKQRVLMARALVGDPSLLVLDEPTSAMDLTAEGALFELVRQLVEGRDLSVIVVSHHLGVLARYATHALLVDKDEELLLAGSVDEIAASRECVERFGHVLMAARRESA